MCRILLQLAEVICAGADCLAFAQFAADNAAYSSLSRGAARREGAVIANSSAYRIDHNRKSRDRVYVRYSTIALEDIDSCRRPCSLPVEPVSSDPR
jgi:hypothetical protein